MKNENLLPPADDHSHKPSFPGLQREIMQLHEVSDPYCLILHEPCFLPTSYLFYTLLRPIKSQGLVNILPVLIQ